MSTQLVQLVQVEFNHETLEAARVGDRIWLVLRRLCEIMGVDTKSQMVKLKGKSWAASGMVEITMTAADGKQYPMTCIDLKTLPGWLFSLSEGKVRPEVREKLKVYQAECVEALNDYFFGQRIEKTGDDQLDIYQGIIQSCKLGMEHRIKILELERANALTRRLAAEADKKAEEAKVIGRSAMRVAAAALNQADANYGYFSVLGYNRLMGREVTSGQSSVDGKKLKAICVARGLYVGTVSDARYGKVHTYPQSVMAEFYGDSAPTIVLPVDRN